MLTHRVYGKTTEGGAPRDNLIVVYKAGRKHLSDDHGEELGRTIADPVTGKFEVRYNDWPYEVVAVAYDRTTGTKYEAASLDWVVGQYVGSDPHYENVVLLLQMDGVNNGTSFPDTSPLAHSINVFGTVVTSTAIKKFGTASAKFAGTVGSYLQVPHHSAFNMGVSDLCIEFFVYFNNTAGTQTLICRKSVGASGGGFLINCVNGFITVDMYHASGPGSSAVSNTAVSAGQMYHFAISRKGNVFKGFLKGEEVLTFSSASQAADSTYPITIGAQPDGSQPLNGYLDALEITKNAFRYPDYFPEPSTAPHQTYGDPLYDKVVLLLKANGSGFYDASYLNNPLQVDVEASLETVGTKYASHCARFTGVRSVGGILVRPRKEFVIGDQDFCFELWAKRNSVSVVTQVIFAIRHLGRPTFAGYLQLRSDDPVAQNMEYVMNVSADYLTSTQRAVGVSSANVWAHYAISRSGSTVRTFKDGVLQTTFTHSLYIASQTGVITIGYNPRNVASIRAHEGLVEDCRFTIGSPRYTEAFTPPPRSLPTS